MARTVGCAALFTGLHLSMPQDVDQLTYGSSSGEKIDKATMHTQEIWLCTRD